MSFEAIDENVRVKLAQSMAIVERHRDEIVRGMEERLTTDASAQAPPGQAEVLAIMLVDLLIDCACDLAALGVLRNLRPAAQEHRRLRIGGRHYSRFGMALAPVLRDVLGPRISPSIISAWCDAFWFSIRAMEPDDRLQIVRV